MQRPFNRPGTFLHIASMLAPAMLASLAMAQPKSGGFDLADRLAQPSQESKQTKGTEAPSSASQRGRTTLPVRIAANPGGTWRQGQRKPLDQIDLFDALGSGAPEPKSNRKNPHAATSVTATRVASLPNRNYSAPDDVASTSPATRSSRRRPAFAQQGDLARDFINSTAASRDTGGVLSGEEPRTLGETSLSLTPSSSALPDKAVPNIEGPSPSDLATDMLADDTLANDTNDIGSADAHELATGQGARAEHAFSEPEGRAGSLSMDKNHSDRFAASRVGAGAASPLSSTAYGTNVLVSEQLPLIHSRVIGPSQILIGRESPYRIALENRGSVTARQLSTEIRVPAWAEVIHTNASVGTMNRSGVTGDIRVLRWELSSLAAGQTETVDIVLVPKTSQPLALEVSWKYAAVNSTAIVEVQEPKLHMAISGPEEVFFGRVQTYRLAVTNPGTGAAENVFVQLMPPGGGQAVSSYRIPLLAPGEAKSIEIEITAREAGELAMRAVATADGNLHAETEQQILCRKAELSVDWRGPTEKYAGTEATYFFRVRNPGTAAAEQTELEVTLPTGFVFRSASDGHRTTSDGRRVMWKIGSLRPGDDRYLELRGTVNQAGRNELRLAVTTANGNAHDTKIAATEVIALADLKLDVIDPKGPVPVGTEIDYEITVTNRGRTAAESIHVVGLFSEGIEPLEAIGAGATIADGRVGFQTIATLPAGQKIRLKIRAKSRSAGTHLFRAEVVCSDLEIKLAAEETTRFYQDDTTVGPGNRPLESASRASRFDR